MPPTLSKLGRYEILEELGKGAMGIVYLARDPLIGRQVALKTFRLGFSVGDRDIEQFRTRFIREAQSAGILSHPGIVTIHDVVERSEEGLAFIAMEYVRGTNLKVLLQGDAPLDLTFVADVIAQIAAALDYAHEHGVVHRDVKPANVILTADGRVKITDFGIARLNTSNLTQEGQLLGTPNYMAPEQVMGKDVDHRADLFSLGVVLYEMLTGHKPFQGENLTQVSHRIVYEPFTPPEQFVRDLAPPLRAVLERALDKDPSRRFQRARDLAAGLAAAVSARHAADLNETQSVDGFLLPPELPPAPPLPDSTSVVLGPELPPTVRFPVPPAAAEEEGEDSRASATPLPVPVPGAAPGPATLPVRRAVPSPGRIAALVAGAAFAALFAGAAFLLALAWSGRPLATSLAPTAQGEVVSLRHDGRSRLAAGDFAGAAAALARAEQLAPDRPGLTTLRELAAAKAAAFAGAAGRTAEIQVGLDTARSALAAAHYDEAALAAIGVLARDPNHAEARSLLAAVEQAKRSAAAGARDARRADARPPAAAPSEPARPTRENPASGSPAVEAVGEPKLAVTFTTELAEGVVMVYLNGRQLLREPFRFVEKAGFLRTRATGGRFSREITLARPETGELRVYVTPSGRPAQVQKLQANFPAGATRRLSIDLPSGGVAAVSLD